MRSMDNDPRNFEPTPVIDDQPPYGNPAAPQSRNLRKLIVLVAIVAILLLAGGAAYMLLGRPRTAPKDTATPPATGQSNQAPVVPDNNQGQGTSTNYVSNGKDLNLSFTYPSGWTVSPPTNSNPEDQTITVTSPLVSLPGANGQSTTGKVVVSIRPGGTALNELSSGSATAAQASAQIAYSKPTSAQHQYPYLTYVHLAGGANPSGSFEEVTITGVTSFAKDQVIMSASLGQLDPIVSARFYACSGQACVTSSAASLSITNATWLNADVCQQTLAIFQSLQLN